VEGREASSFGAFSWNGNRLGFSVAVAPGAEGLSGMLPATSPAGGPLTALTRDGAPVAVTGLPIKGVQYAFFDAHTGRYEAQYGTPPAAPAAAGCACAKPAAGSRVPRVRVSRRMRMRKVLRRGLVVRVRCSARCRARVRLTTRRGGRTLVVGRADRRLRAGQRRVVVKIKPKMARRLRRLERVRLKVRIRLSDAAGNRRTVTRRVLLVR
jgi:hypothetical protein